MVLLIIGHIVQLMIWQHHLWENTFLCLFSWKGNTGVSFSIYTSQIFPFIGHKKICMPSFDEQLTQLATSLKQIRKISTFIMLNDYISMGKFMFIKIFYKHNLNKATLMLQDDYQRLVKKENKWGSVICQVSKIEPERKIDTFYYLYTKIIYYILHYLLLLLLNTF